MVAVHGHRGARAVLPENTLAGFRYAIDAGADGIELDVQATRDDVLVVLHNPVWKRRVVRRLLLEDLVGTAIPTLRQVLELPGRFQFDIEVKTSPRRGYSAPPARLAELLVAEIARLCPDARVAVLSFDFRVLHAVARIAPHLPLAALYEFGARDFPAIARDAGARIVAPYHRFVTARKVEAAHRAGLQVLTWTANQPRDWKRLTRAGVDGIITDDPSALIGYLHEAGLREN